MPLVPATVGTACANAVTSATPAAGTPITSAQLTTLWQNIATAILTGTGGVATGTVTVTVTSVSGVTTGPGVSGPGVGTGVIS